MDDGGNKMIYLLVSFIFIFIFLLFLGIFVVLFNHEKPIDKLKVYNEEKEKVNISLIKSLSQLIPRKWLKAKSGEKLKQQLIKADIPIDIEELFIIQLLSSFSFGFLGYSLSRNFIICLVIIVLVWNVPKLIIAKKIKDRIRDFEEQINEGIMIISNSLKAGYSFMQAIQVVAQETTGPFAKEFKRLLKEMSLGMSIEDSMNSMLKRMDSQDLKLIVNAILIQKDIGGNLSEILDNISETIRERQKIKNELKTLTAQGKLSGIIVMSMPFFLGIIIYVFNNEYILVLFTTKVGLAMTIGALISQMLGLFIIRKIINIDM